MSFLQRQKNFWNEMLWKPKKSLSLDQLKYHHHVLERNPIVTESNKKLIVETFRSIAEILIWGDQNDSSVFDFFLEKNMQSYFIFILSQKCGRYVVLQLLQTLSILFENIRNETSIYYLLSNNHVNSIIVLKLDFSDEEVLAYYISFLKTLSFKLNKHTIHFFYNEHLRDFPLYTEAIKFFNHSESMVRIAVRTLTLNVYKVDDKNMLEFIRNKTAAPYFSNLVWFIGNHILQLDDCLVHANHLNCSQLESLVAEHLDDLHYCNDILSLNVSSLNEILTEHLLNRLFIPLYVYSLFDVSAAAKKEEGSPRISNKIALFLLSQVFLILSNSVLTNQLASLILTGDQLLFLSSLTSGKEASRENLPLSHKRSSSRGSIRGFIPPEESLSVSLNGKTSDHTQPINVREFKNVEVGQSSGNGSSSTESHSCLKELSVIPEYDGFVVIESPSNTDSCIEKTVTVCSDKQFEVDKRRKINETEEEEEEEIVVMSVTPVHNVPIVSTVFIDSILSSMIPPSNDDSLSLFAISLFYALIHNEGVDPHLLEAFSLKETKETHEKYYLHNELVGRLLSVIEAAAVGSVRLITLHMCISLLTSLVDMSSPVLTDHHKKKLERAVEGSCVQLSVFYKNLGSTSDDMFLEMFEDEHAHNRRFRLQVNYLLMDASLLLPPTETPLTGIDFTRRLPCGDTEKARRAMRVFFSIREFWLNLRHEEETELPLTPSTTSVTTEDLVDTSNCDLVSCKVVIGETTTERFMLVTNTEFMLVNPHKSMLGSGVVKFIAFLQDVDISSDPADNCALFIVAHHRSKSQVKRRPALSAKFVFEDHIRCLATKRSLLRRKDCLRHHKMNHIATILGIAPLSVPSNQHNSASLEILQETSEGKFFLNDNASLEILQETSEDKFFLHDNVSLEILQEASEGKSFHSLLEKSELSHPVTAKQALAVDSKKVSSKDQETLELYNIKERQNDTSSEHVHYMPNTEAVTLPLKILPPLEPETAQPQVHSEQNDVDSQLESGLDKDDFHLNSEFDKDGNGHNRTNDLIHRD